MPRAHDDCKFRDEWLVQDKYKEWVVKDGDPRLARCQFCMKSSKFHHPWTVTMPMAMHESPRIQPHHHRDHDGDDDHDAIDGKLVFEVKSLS